MADPRTFTLIGSFEDRITPSLEKINKSLASVKANLESVSKATKPLKTDFRQLASLSDNFAKGLKAQAGDIKNMTAAMKAMRREMGRVNRAYKAGGRSIVQDSRRFNTPPPPPRTPRFATPPPPPRTPRYNYTEPPGGGGGRGGRGSGTASYGGAVAGGVVGMQLGNLMTDAIVRGFNMGVSIMQKPFQFFAGALRERRADEMSDIRTAGGLFSIARRMEKPFVKNFREAEQLTQDNNLYLAKLAGTLPGSTQEYIQVSKQISDGIYTAIANDEKNSIRLANKFAVEAGRAPIEAKEGPEAVRKAGTEIIGEMTKLTVLAGLGGRQGPYGLPQLTERMIAQDDVAMGQFRRYSAIFRDPMIMGALERNIEKINGTAKNTADRIEALRNTFTEIVTPELVNRFRRSVDGLLEGLNTAFFEPEVGLFGLGRRLKDVTYKMNVFGEYLDEYGNVTTDATKYVRESQGVFEILRNVFADVLIVLTPIAEILPQIYDPLAVLGKELSDIREYTAWFLRSFEFYKKGLEDFANTFSDPKIRAAFQQTVPARAALSAIAAVLKSVGAIDMSEFKAIGQKLEMPDVDLGEMLKGLVDSFMKSKAAYNVGNAIGRVVGTVISETGKFMSQLAGLATAGPLSKGISEGFDAAGGREGIKNIFKSLFALIGKLFMEVISSAPLESAMVVGFAALPAIISGVVTAAITRVFSKGLPSLGQAFTSLLSRFTKVVPAKVVDLGTSGTRITDPRRMLPAAKGVAGVAGAAKGVGGLGKGLGTLGKTLKSLGKAIPGLNIAFAGLDFTLGKMAGEDTATAVAGALGGLSGGLIGAAIGTAILPGLGTAIGTVVGTGVGDWVATSLTPYVKKVFSDPAGAIDQAKAGLQSSENKLKEWFLSLPAKFGGWQKQFENGVEDEWMGLGFKFDQWQRTFGIWIQKFSTNTTADTSSKLSEFSARMTSLFKEGINWQSLADTLVEGARGFFANASSRLQALGNAFNWIREQYRQGYTEAPLSDTETQGRMRYDGNTTRPARPLSAAISSEMRHKPSGSDLVIANSSETVIPAAGGHGMEAFIGTMHAGFNSIVQTYTQVQQKQESTLNKINSTLVSNQQQTNTRLSTLETKFTSPSMGGLGGGSIGGGVDAFTPMAQQMGLTMTSGYRPGDSGWHGANRARDFSNGTGPTPQMMQFAQMLASKYGSNLKELIYTPLGFSIKNGQQVAPYAQGAHYNHVHVAYANGIGQGMAFNSLKGAEAWESSMVNGSVKVASVTTNSGEGFGGSPININAPITINQQAGQSADELASIVAMKIGEAVADARAASIFV